MVTTLRDVSGWGMAGVSSRSAGGWLAASRLVLASSTGNACPSGSSQAFRLRYRDPNRTLVEEQVEQVHSAVIASVQKRFKAQLRE